MHLSRPITLWIDEQVSHWGEFRRLMALRHDLAAFAGGALKLRRAPPQPAVRQAARAEEGDEPEEEAPWAARPRS